MKKYGNYIMAVSLIFSAAVFGASLIDQASVPSEQQTQATQVDVMGNVAQN